MAEKLAIRAERDRAKAHKWVDRVPLGWTLVFKPPARNNEQNARLWAFLDDIALQKEWEGKKRTSENWKDLFTACLRGQEIVRGLEGGIVALGSRTSEMGVEEMSNLLALIEAWGAQNGVVFRDGPTDSAAGNVTSPDAERGGE